MKRLSILIMMLGCCLIAVFAQSKVTTGMIVTNDGESFKAYNIDYSPADFCYYTLTEKSDDLKRMRKDNILIIKLSDGTKIDPSNAVGQSGAMADNVQRSGALVSEAPVRSTESVAKGETSGALVAPRGSRYASGNTTPGINPHQHEPVTFDPVSGIKTDKKGNQYVAVGNGRSGVIRMRIISDQEKTLAVAPEGDGIEYEDHEYVIPEYVNLNGDVYTVVSVDKRAFGYSWGNEEIDRIIFPNTLKRIEDEAFFKLENLREICLPESIESIGDYAFGGCGKDTSFDYIYIPVTIKHIGREAFRSVGDKTSYRGYFQGFLKSIPDFITTSTCLKYGIDEEAVEAYDYRTKRR